MVGGGVGCPCSILFCWREDRVEWGEPELAGWMSCFLRWGGGSRAWKRAEAGREREAVTCGRSCTRVMCHQEALLPREQPGERLSCYGAVVTAAFPCHLWLCGICFAYRT